MAGNNPFRESYNYSKVLNAFGDVPCIYVGGNLIKYADLKDITITDKTEYKGSYSKLRYLEHRAKYRASIAIRNDYAVTDPAYSFQNISGIQNLYNKKIVEKMDRDLIHDIVMNLTPERTKASTDISSFEDILVHINELNKEANADHSELVIFYNVELVDMISLLKLKESTDEYDEIFWIGNCVFIGLSQVIMQDTLYVGLKREDAMAVNIKKPIKVINPEENQEASSQDIYDVQIYDMIYTAEKPLVFGSVKANQISILSVEPEVKKARKKKAVKDTE